MGMKRSYSCGSFFVCLCSLALISVGIGTTYWTTGTLVAVTNSTNPECTVYRHIGLFDGTDEETESCLSSGKYRTFNIKDGNCLNVNEATLTAVIAFCFLSVILLLTATGLSILNALCPPSQDALGGMGLLVCYSLALVSTFVAVIIYVVLLYTQLFEFYKTEDKYDCAACYSSQCDVTMNEYAYFGYSFWLNVISLFTISLGIVCVLLSSKDMPVKLMKQFSRHENAEKPSEDVMMF